MKNKGFIRVAQVLLLVLYGLSVCYAADEAVLSDPIVNDLIESDSVVNGAIASNAVVSHTEVDSTAVDMPSANSAIIQTFIGLALVVGVIYLLAWLVKRLNLGALGQNNQIKIVTSMPLGTREKAVLLNVQGHQILLGVAPGRVSTLHVFEPLDESNSEEAKSIDVEREEIPVEGNSAEVENTEVENTEVESAVVSPESKARRRGMISSLAANSASEFSKKLNVFLGQGNRF